jgi:hypothetical protein
VKQGSNSEITSCSKQYTDEENYLLAFWFTLVKVLFIKGQLHYIPPLLEMIHPLCEGHDLHNSNIRNEAAYFSCIRDLFKTYDRDIPATKLSLGENYIYFIGDSHCIPPAWQKITVKVCILLHFLRIFFSKVIHANKIILKRNKDR